MYYLIPYKNSEPFDRLIEGLVKAGYKATPSDYYKLKKENKLTGQEIQELIFGKTMEGKIFNISWSITTIKDGKTEYTNPMYGEHIHKGKSWIEGDAVCRQYEAIFDGMKDCAEVYKIPEGNKSTYSEYLSLTEYMILPFSIKKTASQDSSREKKVLATTMNANNVAVNLKGEWDTVYDLKEYGVYEDVVQITQIGNTFVGIKLVGTQFSPKGSETIKGDVEDNRIKSMFLKTTQGWMPAECQVNEQGDEILLKVPMESMGLTVDVKLIRK